MGSTGYKLLGFTVWHGARWYVRRRVRPSRGLIVRTTLGAVTLLGAAALARRLAA